MTDQRPSRDSRESRDSSVGPDDEGSVFDVSAPTPPAGIALGRTGLDDNPDRDDDSPIRRPALVDGDLDLDAPAPQELVDLAAALGVAAEVKDWQGKTVPVSTRTLCGVLVALDMPVRTGRHVRAALDEVLRGPSAMAQSEPSETATSAAQ